MSQSGYDLHFHSSFAIGGLCRAELHLGTHMLSSTITHLGNYLNMLGKPNLAVEEHSSKFITPKTDYED